MPNPGDDARRKLIEREKAAQLYVIAEFKKIQNRISAELFQVIKRIDTAQRTAGNAPVGLLIEQARLRALFDQVTDEIADASRRLGIVAESSQRRAIEIARTQAGEYVELATQLNQFDADATRNLIGLAGDGGRLDRHFASIAKPVREQMFESLFYGLATGRPNQAIAREVNQAIGYGAARAMTIVRTETNRAYRESSREFYADAPGVVGWRWLAACDLRTCLVCWSQHGKVFKTRTKFATHPNCRCTMVPVFADGAADLAETGPAKFARLTIEQQRTVAGPRRLDLYNQGANLADFVEVYRSPFGAGRRIKSLERTKFRALPRTPAASASGRRLVVSSGSSATPESALKAFEAIKAGTPVPKFKTTAEATEYFEQRYPATRFDFAGMEIEKSGLFQANVDELARLFDTYPEAIAKLEYVGTYVDKTKIPRRSNGRFTKGEYAHAGDDAYIAFNPKWYGNAQKYQDSKKRGREIGHSVTDAPQGTATHEFGHIIDAWINRTFGRAFFFPFTDGPGGRGSVPELFAKVRAKYRPTPGELSDYGRTNRYELFAEGFSMHWNRPESEHSRYTKILIRLIEKVRQAQTYVFGNMKLLDEMSDAERRAAKRQINDLYSEFGITPPYKKKEL